MRLRKKEQGFSIIEALIIVVIVAVIGFAGWYVYNARKDTNSNTADTSATTPTPSPTLTTSEQPDTAKFDEYFTSFVLAKLAIGQELNPSTSAGMPTDTTVFNLATDQFCTNMIIKKTIPSGSYVGATYNVSTEQSDNETKMATPIELKQGGSIGCEPLSVTAGTYEYKAYIDGVLVADLPFTVE